jgi:ribosomal-protein-serine acetyltransferase
LPKVDNPVLLEIPNSFETARLMIRVPRPGDGQLVYEAVQESLPELKPWLPWAQRPQTVDGIETLLRRDAGRFILREDFTMLAFRKDDDAFVARLSLHGIVWSVPMLEIGYWVRSRLGRQGYVTEAVRGLTSYAFTHLLVERTLSAVTPEMNAAPPSHDG